MVLLLGNQMTKRLCQLGARLEDWLKVCRAQSQEQARAEGRESGTRSHTGQERYFAKRVAGTQPSQFEFSSVLSLMCYSNNAKENELDRLRFRSLH